jgi:ribosomal protein S3
MIKDIRMINKIKKILGMEYEIDNKVFRKALSSYPYYNGNISGAYLRTITKVYATKKNNNITVHIKTHSPGILIGAKGKQISEIKSYMELLCKCSIEIDIQEETMFFNLYS